MRWRVLVVLCWFAMLAACGGDAVHPRGCDICVDAHPVDAISVCSPVMQTGCKPDQKCTWIVDGTMPQYVGHTGCVPDGTVQLGAPCAFGAAGATGYDDCQRGGICSAYVTPGTTGVCEQICDNQGGVPMCDATHACANQSDLFVTGHTSPVAAGVCLPTCDPLADNDFDGSGSALSRTGSACGSAENGCFGLPSHGIPPKTQFACMPELHYAVPLRHRVECTWETGCLDPYATIQANSCNQGYEPALQESTAVTTIVCAAMCKPLDCYAGNCGSNNANRLGAAPHRCTPPDAVGNFGSDEECQYLWAQELDGSGHWLPSPYSDTVGICVDHAAYGVPSCKDVPLHGSGAGPDAVSLGCVSSQTAVLQ